MEASSGVGFWETDFYASVPSVSPRGDQLTESLKQERCKTSINVFNFEIPYNIQDSTHVH